jgi:hypothetical protein
MSLEKELEGWYAVYPGSEKLDLGEKRAVAYFRIEQHAEKFSELYKPYGYIKKVTKTEYTCKDTDFF